MRKKWQRRNNGNLSDHILFQRSSTNYQSRDRTSLKPCDQTSLKPRDRIKNCFLLTFVSEGKKSDSSSNKQNRFTGCGSIDFNQFPLEDRSGDQTPSRLLSVAASLQVESLVISNLNAELCDQSSAILPATVV